MVAALAYVLVLDHQDTNFADRGLRTMETIRREFRIKATPGFAEALEPGIEMKPVFNWGLGVLISAMNGAARQNANWKADLKEVIGESRKYWNQEGPCPGFDVLPSPKQPDRYYDDNAWMVLALVESSEVLKDRSCLKLAEDALKFVLSGEDEKLGGGIYWREREKRSKNTCSNAPAAAACLALFEKTKRQDLLKKAISLYEWTKANLRDPSDGLFWDSISLSGKVDKTKWSYNTALMIRSAAMLYRITTNAKYQTDAEEMAEASEKRWLLNGRFADAGRFAHLLIESWAFVPNEKRINKTREALTWLWEHGRNARGLFGGRFDAPPSKDQAKFELIDQASAARAFFIAR